MAARIERVRCLGVTITTTPSLRATSPQEEAFCLRGAVVETTEGVSKIRIKGRPMIAPTKKVCVVS